MRKVLLTIVLFLSLNMMNAQVSGYLGKKFSIIYSGSVGVIPHVTNVSIIKTEVLPTFHNALAFEYVFSNSMAVGLRYKIGLNSGLNNPQNDKGFQGFEEKYKFYSHTYGAYVKFYKRNSLAPVGLFTLVGLNFQQLIIKDLIRPNFIDKTTITKQNYVQYDMLLSVGMGRNWIVMDRMLLGFQVEFGYPVASVFNAVGLTPFSSGGNDLVNDSPYNGYESTAILSRFNMTAELLKITLNIGFLAF